MRFRSRAEEEVDVNLTPLIDVVFLLLIFFMVTTTFNRHAELKVQLPQASAEQVKAPDEVLEVIIDAEGSYFVNGKALVNNRAETVIKALRKERGTQGDAPMVIRADARTPHQSVVTVMDAAGRIGITRLSIATSQAEPAQ